MIFLFHYFWHVPTKTRCKGFLIHPRKLFRAKTRNQNWSTNPCLGEKNRIEIWVWRVRPDNHPAEKKYLQFFHPLPYSTDIFYRTFSDSWKKYAEKGRKWNEWIFCFDLLKHQFTGRSTFCRPNYICHVFFQPHNLSSFWPIASHYQSY